MQNEIWYKIVNGTQLESIDTTYINNKFERVLKSEEELMGFKPLKKGSYPSTTVYENAIMSYQETENYVEEVYEVVKKPTEEIIQINTDFWNQNYFQVLTLLPTDDVYVPYVSYLNGQARRLLEDDFASLAIALSADQLSYLEVYGKPDFAV